MEEAHDMMVVFVEAFHLSPEQYWKLKPREHAAFIRRLNEKAK